MPRTMPRCAAKHWPSSLTTPRWLPTPISSIPTPKGRGVLGTRQRANATRIRVLVQAPGGATTSDSPREYTASVAGIDTDNDLALLKGEIQAGQIRRAH